MKPLDLINTRLEYVNSEINKCLDEIALNESESIVDKAMLGFAMNYLAHLKRERKFLIDLTESFSASVIEKVCCTN